MYRKILGVVAIVIGCVALLILARGWRPRFPGNPSQQQLRYLTEWHSNATTPIADAELSTKILSIPENQCDTRPPSSTAIPLDKLERNKRKSLLTTLSEIMRIYVENSPQQLIAFMKQRDERIDADSVVTFRRVLINGHGLDPDEVTSMSDEELFLEWANRAGFKPNWQSIILESSCLSVWEFQGARKDVFNSSDLQSFGREVWKSVSNPGREFGPSDGKPLERSLVSPTLFADLLLIVQHNEIYANDRSPYVMRWWYDEGIENWRPVMIAYFSVPDSPIEAQGPLRISF